MTALVDFFATGFFAVVFLAEDRVVDVAGLPVRLLAGLAELFTLDFADGRADLEVAAFPDFF
ncbi:MAG: hypothetical protein ACOYN3_07920 [Acidimicrobiia bacterium]